MIILSNKKNYIFYRNFSINNESNLSLPKLKYLLDKLSKINVKFMKQKFELDKLSGNILILKLFKIDYLLEEIQFKSNRLLDLITSFEEELKILDLYYNELSAKELDSKISICCIEFEKVLIDLDLFYSDIESMLEFFKEKYKNNDNEK